MEDTSGESLTISPKKKIMNKFNILLMEKKILLVEMKLRILIGVMMVKMTV